jgi:potassium-transporting ATPase KdpC subunit
MKNIKITFLLFLVLTIITGILYPFFTTIISHALFPYQASGSFIKDNKGKEIGSELIGQNFKGPTYFWPRPSVIDYNPMPSGGSNLSISGRALNKKMQERKAFFLKNNPNTKIVPADMLFASGSGLDSDISLASVEAQLSRIIKARHWSNKQKEQLVKLIKSITEKRDWSILGEPHINVLKLNLALDRIR